MHNIYLDPNWSNFLTKEIQKEYFQTLMRNIESEYAQYPVYPPRELIFEAFNQCSFDNMKVVILGQDPYHNENQAMGLSFSVLESEPIPPSLHNIFKEIESNTGIKPYQNGDLTRWATQGVLLLNTTLTVRAHQPLSHHGYGWEIFTNEVIRLLSSHKHHLVFLLWGKNAQQKSHLIDSHKHLIVESSHPSPLSAYRGFMGCKHFSQANEYLQKYHISPIDWK
jgi:uracil-DNA glycosylase